MTNFIYVPAEEQENRRSYTELCQELFKKLHKFRELFPKEKTISIYLRRRLEGIVKRDVVMFGLSKVLREDNPEIVVARIEDTNDWQYDFSLNLGVSWKRILSGHEDVYSSLLKSKTTLGTRLIGSPSMEELRDLERMRRVYQRLREKGWDSVLPENPRQSLNNSFLQLI